MKPTSCCSYHRVSTLDQDPELAREELRTAATARGFEIVLEIEETGSGARNNRPGWQKVLQAARKGEIGAVIVWKLDRAGRSALDLMTNVEELGRCGVRFICATQGIDIKPDGDAISKLLLTMLSAVSEFERSLTRERTRLAIDQARKKGTRIGRPFTKMVPELAEIARLRSLGASWDSIAKTLNCSSSTARRTFLKGPRKQAFASDEKRSAA
jgi:DNA invertase Pin-like site-specific DNA recombinase